MTSNKHATSKPTIGLVLDFFNPQILDGAHAYAAEHGLRLDARWSVRGDWTPNEPGWDAVIYGIVDDLKLQKRVKKWRIPKVGLMPEGDETWQVTPDYQQCGTLAADELIKSGAALLLNCVVTNRRIDQAFAMGVSQAAERSGIPCHMITTHETRLSGVVEELLPEIISHPYPLGFCQPHAGIAFSLQKTMLEQKIRIPEDVLMAVINKDIQRTPEFAPVALTTVELDEWHRGFVAAEMLHRQLINNPAPQKNILIPPKGITRRASTGHIEVKDRIVAMTLSYIREHYLSPISVADVVATVGVSRRVVETRFRALLNRGVHEELSRLRIEEAKRRITNKDTSITTIAEHCGFSSVHYFSAAFKKQTGISPKQYQKKST